MNRLPPLKSLQAFRYAAELESFKDAAEKLHVTQAAVSQQMKTLEQALGVQLFRRLTREVELTSEAKQLQPAISEAFQIMEHAVARLHHDPQPNQLTLSTLPSFASRWLVSRLGHYQQQDPDITLHLSPSLGLAKFGNNDLDIAIRFGQGDYPGLESRLLFNEHLLPVCHPSLIQGNQPIHQQLAQLPLLTDEAPDMVRIWPAFSEAIGIDLSPNATRLFVSDSTMLVEAVLSGQGFALLRYSLAYQLLERGLLICPIPIYMRSAYDFYLVAPELHFKRPKVQRFESWLRDEVEEITQSWQTFKQQNNLLRNQ